MRWTDAEGSQKIQRPNANAKADGYESVRFFFFCWQKGAGAAWLQHPAAADNSKTGRNPHTTQRFSTTIIQMRSDTMQLAEVTAMEAYALGCYCYSQFTATRNRPMVTWLDRQVGNQRLGRRTRVV